MKALALIFSIMIVTMACNNEDPMEDPMDDPMDDPLPPTDTALIEIKNKWEGYYIGTVNLASYSPTRPPIFDTLYDQKIEISNFNRNSGFEDWVKVTMVFNDSYIDSGYYGIETELLSDTALLIRFDEAFSDSHSEIILNHTDSTLITDYENYPLPGGGNTRHGYYKKN